jgi:hypothetical protein
MSRLVARAESWERAYDAFQNVNFAAFDYNTVKQSLLDYVKLYFPETFNDFIESSEFIAIVEVFAYVAELLAYRLDLNAHENFISTAQRKDSVLRLARLVSYTASRPLPARGLVKITSVSTTESVVDSNGNNLANRTIRWNDVSNTSWKDQFILVMNRVLDQQVGSVGPTDRFQIQDVLFELYAWNLSPLATGVFPYTAQVNGQSQPMELVPVSHDEKLGIIERRPQNNANFTLLYGQDGLGDSSETTGFFCYSKQGSLQRFRTSFDGITPNQVYDVTAINVNETDVWVNGVDPITGETIDEPSLLPYRRETTEGKSGEWIQVDLAHAQNVIFNTNPRRNKYEVETRADNKVRLIFGDGEFSDVPQGTFDIWARTSLDEDIVVPQASVVNTPASFTYVDTFGRTQTFTFTFSLISSLQNASSAEDTEHVRVTAPAVYYAQDRMVNGEDYNVFMLQDPSILKLRAVNRTFAGDSKYLPWHDPTGSYENVKLFSDDGVLYFEDRGDTVGTPVIDISALISTYVEPLLSSTDIYLHMASAGVPLLEYRRSFNVDEQLRITDALTPPPTPTQMEMYYRVGTDATLAADRYQWYAIKVSAKPPIGSSTFDTVMETLLPGWTLGEYIETPLIVVSQASIFESRYNVTRTARRLILESQTMSFWNTNSASRVIEYDTLQSDADNIVILKSNVNYNRDGILQSNWTYDVLGQETVTYGEEAGLPDVHRLSVISKDTNEDGVPDDLVIDEPLYHKGVADIMSPKVFYSTPPQFPAAGWQIPPTVGGFDVVVPIYYFVDVDGTEMTADVTITTLGSTNLVAGSGYTDGTYTDVPLTGGSGTGATADMTVSGGAVTSFLLTHGGQQYINGDVLSVLPTSIGGTGTGFSITLQTTTLTQGINDAEQWSVSASSGSYVSNKIRLYNKIYLFPPTVPVGIPKNGGEVIITVNDYVYFTRATTTDPWLPAPDDPASIASYGVDKLNRSDLWKRHEGRSNLNFAWFHRSPRYYLVDPAPSNIIDSFIVTKGYYMSLKRWLEDPLATEPVLPTPLDLRTSYGYLLDNKMISDTIVLHPGKIKLLFGSKATPALQCTFKVIRSAERILTDNQIKTTIVTTVRNFFNITQWEFGETFFFTELAAAIHASLPTEISSVVLVPTLPQNQFGDMFQVLAREDEVFYSDISVNNIEIVSGYTPTNLRLNG